MDSNNQNTIKFLNTMDEGKLWKDFKTGSEEAFTTIYQRYVFELYHYGERITGNHEIIEESVQDLFIDLWKNKTNLADVDQIKYYLFKGLRRQIVRKLQQERKYPLHNIPEEYDFEIRLSPEAAYIKDQNYNHRQEILKKNINALTPRQKEAITLKFYDGLSYQEVSEIMNMSTKATYNLIYRAIDVLKENIDKLTLLLFIGSLL